MAKQLKADFFLTNDEAARKVALKFHFTTRVKTPDSSKVNRDLGFKLMVSVEEGIKRTVEWFKRFYGKSGDALVC